MPEESHQEDNSQKSSDSSEDQQKEEGKKVSLLSNLIVAICITTVCYVGVTFLNCNFLIPGSMERADALGGLKNPPPLDCKESERKGYETLLSVLTTIIALRTKIDD